MIVNPNNITVAEWTIDGLEMKPGKKVVSPLVKAALVVSDAAQFDVIDAEIVTAKKVNADAVALKSAVCKDANFDYASVHHLEADTAIATVLITSEIESTASLRLSDPNAGSFTLSDLADKIKESIGTKRGDLLVFTAPGVAAILPAPEDDGMILVSDKTSPLGMKWSAK